QHDERVGYHLYLQWEADRQLAAVAQHCANVGMSTGLYHDLAVGVDGQGADVWGNHEAFASARVGAPPDQFNAKGQDWGTPPFNPVRLEETAYADFIAVLRANMRHAGALRIDHVMALMHLYWIPASGEATAGAYVRYPFDDLLGIVALESHRHRCLVIGEDLGTGNVNVQGIEEQPARRRIGAGMVRVVGKQGVQGIDADGGNPQTAKIIHQRPQIAEIADAPVFGRAQGIEMAGYAPAAFPPDHPLRHVSATGSNRDFAGDRLPGDGHGKEVVAIGKRAGQGERDA
ncbi:MAG: 4-alpha-glucanotransferase, partial [Alphaproteobacteria bacterium]|nr:4-alpha-glucanotransferase [Alphaproteobacteria bacterium]